MNVAVLTGLSEDRRSRLSHLQDWQDAFYAHPGLTVDFCDVENRDGYRDFVANLNQYELIVWLELSASWNLNLKHVRRSAPALADRKGKLVCFVANEYADMWRKRDFLRAAQADLVCSRLSQAAAEYLYGPVDGLCVLSLPEALAPEFYHSGDGGKRNIDIGYRGDWHRGWTGHRDRTELLGWFICNRLPKGFVFDISRDACGRIDRKDWADFLRRCKGTAGAESGVDYLNGHGALVDSARAWAYKHPEASFEDIFDRFFHGETPIRGRHVSSRHLQACGTKACQILVEGEYNGVLTAGEHYIPVARNLSNIDDAVAQFRDWRCQTEIVERAYAHAREHHTYAHRIDRLLQELENLS